MEKHVLFSWGLGCEGVLGTPAELDEQGICSKPVKMHGIYFSTVSCGAFHVVGISEGKLYSWGRSGCGRLGFDPERDHIDVPTRITNNSLDSVYFVQVSCGAHHTLALGDNGHIYAFGSGFSGQCGQGNRVDVFEPTLVQAETKFIFISAGYYHSLAIDGNNQIWSWGSGQKGQLGHGAELKWLPKPKKIVFADNSRYKFKFIASGELNSLAITLEGDIFIWGSNMCGQLCNGKSEKKHFTSVPTLITNPKKIPFKYATLGINHVFSISDNNELYFWGRSLTSSDVMTLTEIPSPNGVGIVSVSTSPHHALAVTDKGGLLSWGAGFYGQLGHSNNNTTTEPKYVPNLKNVIAASCGTYFSMILASIEPNSNNCEDEDPVSVDSPSITPRTSSQKSGKDKLKSPLKVLQKRSSPRSKSPVTQKSPKRHHRSSNKSSPDTPSRKKYSTDNIASKTSSDSTKVSVHPNARQQSATTLASSIDSLAHTTGGGSLFKSIRTQTDSIITIAAEDLLEDNEVRPYRSLSARLHTKKFDGNNNTLMLNQTAPLVSHSNDEEHVQEVILSNQEIKEKLHELALEEKALKEQKARIREALNQIQEKRKKLLQLL